MFLNINSHLHSLNINSHLHSLNINSHLHSLNINSHLHSLNINSHLHICFHYNIGEEFEDTEGVIRIRKSKDRQHNGQKKKGQKLSTKHYT
jgi:hypothetical protein